MPAQEEAARPQTPLRVVAETVKFAEATAEAAETVTAVKAVRGKSSGALPVDVLRSQHAATDNGDLRGRRDAPQPTCTMSY